MFEIDKRSFGLQTLALYFKLPSVGPIRPLIQTTFIDLLGRRSRATCLTPNARRMLLEMQETLDVDTQKVRSRSSRVKWLAVLYFELKVWLWVLLPFWIMTTFVFTITTVDGVSMMPTLRNGERILVQKYGTWLHRLGIGDFKRGDMIIFKPPQNAPGAWYSFYGLWNYRPFFVKRIIAVGGDTIKLDQGQVWVNGQAVEDDVISYWRQQGCWDQDSTLANFARNDFQNSPLTKSFKVPKGEYFVMGDNRSSGGSEDSRLFGSIPLSDISGRVGMVWFPWRKQAQADYDCTNHSVQFSGQQENNVRIFR